MDPQRAHELRPRLILVAIAVACVIVPYLTWRQTWFGRRLSQAEVGQYLGDEQHPRKIQHALTFLGEQMARADPSARVWYPGIVQAAHRPSVEIRTLAAWTMGQDNQSDILHRALLVLLDDPEVLVRRNAALALVRFGDAQGRRELTAILRPLAPGYIGGHRRVCGLGVCRRPDGERCYGRPDGVRRLVADVGPGQGEGVLRVGLPGHHPHYLNRFLGGARG